MNIFKNIKKLFWKMGDFLYKFFISLKLAVFTLSALAVLTGLGTVIESRYDQEMANKLVYHSFWMAVVMFLLAINLAMVLIDRWPWKKRHTGFVMAHIGILILILGSVFTKYFGFDGSLRFEEGETADEFSVSDMEIKIYSSYDAENFTLIYEKPADMFFIKPSEQKPYIISAGGEEFVIDKYLPFAVGRKSIKLSKKGHTPSVRFHLEGSQASIVEWMSLESGKNTLSQNVGPATISLTKDKSYKPKNKKELVLLIEGDKIFYLLTKTGKKLLKKGESFLTGWMDFKFRLLEFFPKSQKEFIFSERDRPSPATVKALRVNWQGNSVWLGQNSHIRFFKKDQVYAITYLNKTYKLGFDLKLLDFRIKTYQGSNQAKNYESEVQLNNESRLISMNEPLKYGGWTLYQSSFEPSEDGSEPVVSILSVNRDPGRFLKYFGSILIVLGATILFYRRKMRYKG